MDDTVSTQSPTPRGRRPVRWAVPSLGDVIFMVVSYVAIRLGGNLTHRDGDLGRHIRLGRSVLDDGVIPQVDVYSHTLRGGEMIPHEWVSQTVFAATERWFGFDGIGLLTAVASSLPWAILYRWLVLRGNKVGISAGLALLGAAASMIHWAARPHMFTWLFVVVWVLLLEDHRKGIRGHVWWLIPLTTLWANTHGAFIVGLVLIATYLGGALLDREKGMERRDRRRHLLVILGACIAASLLNPDGLATIVNGFSYTGEEFLLAFTREYNSPDFHNPLFWPFLAMIMLSIVLPIRWNATQLLLVLSWTGFALYSFRNIPLYALVTIPILAAGIRSWRSEQARGRKGGSARLEGYAAIERQAIGGLVSLLFLAVLVASLASRPGSAFEFEEGYFPVKALELTADHPPGEHLFNEFAWGGYIEYCCHPAIPVFIDGQTDYYGAGLTKEYDLAIEGRSGWRSVFMKYRVDWVLISPESALAQVLIEADDWDETYRDTTSVIFAPSP